MDRWERELAALELKGEREVLDAMRGHYRTALERVYGRIDELSERDDLPGIRQRRFQEALAEQIGGILDELGGGAHATLEGYLRGAYEDGFVGALYSLQRQGVPLAFPLDQEAMARAATTSADGVKLSERVYSNTARLKRQVVAEITRGFADSSHVVRTAGLIASEADVASEVKRNVKGRADQAMRRSMTIARTEKGRVVSDSNLDAMRKARAAGADVVKQWDSTLDGRTRKSHRKLDGQIRELDEPFEVGGRKAMAPHKFGRPEEDINCRCRVLQRSRTALEMPEEAAYTKWDGASQRFVDLSDAKSYSEFKRRFAALTGDRIESGGVSGAYNDVNDPYMQKRDAHARRYYAEVRNRDKAAEVSAVAAGSGLGREAASAAYDHLFVIEHELDGGRRRFDPMYEIAESWRRLREGKDVQPHDVVLVQHEALEHELMQQGLSYAEAHEEAQKVYNYAEALKAFEESGGA